MPPYLLEAGADILVITRRDLVMAIYVPVHTRKDPLLTRILNVLFQVEPFNPSRCLIVLVVEVHQNLLPSYILAEVPDELLQVLPGKVQHAEDWVVPFTLEHYLNRWMCAAFSQVYLEAVKFHDTPPFQIKKPREGAVSLLLSRLQLRGFALLAL